jgi:hypothetical protein
MFPCLLGGMATQRSYIANPNTSMNTFQVFVKPSFVFVFLVVSKSYSSVLSFIELLIYIPSSINSPFTKKKKLVKINLFQIKVKCNDPEFLPKETILYFRLSIPPPCPHPSCGLVKVVLWGIIKNPLNRRRNLRKQYRCG